MVGGFREKEYQLSAQKKNEAAQRFDYYQQTARYFQREGAIARHLDTWNFRNPNKEHEEKACKTEDLDARQAKLQQLLRSDDELYRKELNEFDSKKKDKEDHPPLEVLKEKLQEKRSEQQLYFPRHNYCENDQHQSGKPLEEKVSKADSDIAWEKSHGASWRFKGACPFNLRTGDEPKVLSAKYSERNSHTSLGETNMRSATYAPHREPVQDHHDDKARPSRGSSISYDSPNDSHAPHFGLKNSKNYWEHEDNALSPEIVSEKDNVEDNSVKFHERDQDRADGNQNSPTFERTTSMKLEYGKTGTWPVSSPRETSLVKKHRYLAHNEIKQLIEEMEERETAACRTHKWQEALRMHDMRTRLEFQRERELFDNLNLHLDDKSRQLGLASIEKRALRLKEREKICEDTSMFSEDAKHLWNKWKHEDEDDLANWKECAARDILLQDLEDEWKIFSLKDKEKAVSDQNNALRSSLQEELELSASMSSVHHSEAYARHHE
ncbi:uncharacterized protein LOC107266923 isoform X2 [Cephus cinctus]|uniref:Uncharacterized protein LOC107266923 isoform X2 n=1 Tax=Cephus cinctus TaxID=211228 RepID=A0AAJ7FIH4_CEPCN|nr:uncharacterized protein LOC107266923 isoform X2 [Cephus cinctus]